MPLTVETHILAQAVLTANRTQKIDDVEKTPHYSYIYHSEKKGHLRQM